MPVPKWVMCGVCGEMLWAGPSNYSVEGKPLPRECGCRATIVVPTQERGFVRWNEQAYRYAAEEGVRAEHRKKAKRAATDAAMVAAEAGVPQSMREEYYLGALQDAQAKLDATFATDVEKYPTEPEIEYAEEGEVLIPPAPVPAQPTTISQLYKAHWKDVEEGNG